MLKLVIGYIYLMILGQHIGHSIYNTLIANSWFISVYRRRLTIMNLLKSTLMYKVAFSLFKSSSGRLAPIWFVNLDPHLAGLVIQSARRSGEFYVTDIWVRGLVSNFKSMKKLYFKLSHTNPLGWTRMERGAGKVFTNWDFTRVRRAGLVFIPNLRFGRFAARECIQSCTPSVGIVDSDLPSFELGVPIAGNDESMLCLSFYNDVAVGQILIGKFRKATAWYFGIWSRTRRSSFFNWLNNYYAITVILEGHDYSFDATLFGENSYKAKELINETLFAKKDVFFSGSSAMVLNNFRTESTALDIELFHPSDFFYDTDKMITLYHKLYRNFLGYNGSLVLATSLASTGMFYRRRFSFYRRFFRKVNIFRGISTLGWIKFRFNRAFFRTKYRKTTLYKWSLFANASNYFLKTLHMNRKIFRSFYTKKYLDIPKKHSFTYYVVIFLMTKFSNSRKFYFSRNKLLLSPDKAYSFVNYLLSSISRAFDHTIWRRLKPAQALLGHNVLYHGFFIDFAFKWFDWEETHNIIVYMFKKKTYMHLFFMLSRIYAKIWYYDVLITYSIDFKVFKVFDDLPFLSSVWFHRRSEYFMELSNDFLNSMLSTYQLSSSWLLSTTQIGSLDAQYETSKQFFFDKLTRYTYYVSAKSYYL